MPTKNFFMIERKARIQQLMDMLKKHPDMPINKIKGLLMLQTGASFKRINEYLSELTEGCIIEYDSETNTYKVLV